MNNDTVYARVRVHYVKGLLRKREITPIRVGKTTLIDREDLDKYLEKLKAQQVSANGNGDGNAEQG